MNGPELFEPVFEFLDTLIEEQGHIIYMVLVYVSVPLIAWILSGGLRRKSLRGEVAATIVPIIVIRPPAQPPPLPPVIGGDPERERGRWPSDDEDSSSSFAA